MTLLTSPQETGAPQPSQPSRTLRIGLGLSAIILYSAVLLCAEAYLFYKAPIKPDRYGHAFSRHVRDRLAAYAMWLKSPAKAERATMPIETVSEILATTSARNGVDGCLAYAVAAWESGLNPHAISTTGAVGLMALQPGTLRKYSVEDPFDPYANADAGTRLLGQFFHDYQGNLDLILAAYNGGPGAVDQFHGVPPYRETTDYVKHVGHLYRICKAEH
jgi:soluble lytic murein transglycosylase-like protein